MKDTKIFKQLDLLSTNMIVNDGYVDDWTLFHRYLILGSVSKSAVKNQEIQEIIGLLLTIDGTKAIDRIVEISQSGCASKNDFALFALAIAAASLNKITRQYALKVLPKIARTGGHLLQFADYIRLFRGFGRSLRGGISKWFTEMPIDLLTLQAVKYPQYKGWGLRDLMRLAHPKCEGDEVRKALFHWIVNPKDSEAIRAARQLRLIEGKYQVKESKDIFEIASIVRKYSLPREALPTHVLNSVEVWDALLVDMPMSAMVRNLGKMSQVGLLAPYASASEYVVNRLQNTEELRQARMSPFKLLTALRTYSSGKGRLGHLHWTPIEPITTALNLAFEASLVNFRQAQKQLFAVKNDF
jgi:60 kDa SS-A/Ro ribonucleoprotein